jgi:ribosomal protein S18 acetylase RimI-like enzyme
MVIEIIIPKSKKELTEGRELNYEYTKQIGAQPLLRPYFETQHFDADIDKMPQGYEAPDGVYLIAYVDGIAAGTVAVRRLDETTCEMKRLYVRPAFQGIGLGRRLAEKAIAEAKMYGYSRMRLDNSKSVMARANALYTSLGFYEIEPYNRNFVADAYFMEKML